MRAICCLLALLSATAQAAEAPPKLRLPSGARPTHYTAELTVDPTQERFSGALDIDITVSAPLEVLWLNAAELSISKATIGGVAAAVVPGGKDFVGLQPARRLTPGSTRVHLEYTGVLSSKDTGGASRQKEGDDWYVFTHFEPIDARRVFPCFDEPGYKTPWTMALRVRARDRALFNTPETGTTALPDGWKRVAFAPTKPLPSYLVALAVGPFELVEAGRSAKSGTPVRIVTPKGQRDRARWAAEVTHQLLEQLEDYFGSSYPYEKVDCIAVPLFGGAMENPGLMTFASALILQRFKDETIERRRAYAHVAMHELAHQWFGDLVTTAWWDDLWLNEAFASWMTPKMVARWQPSWGAEQDRLRIRANAMWADSLVSARTIRQPIVSNDDMKNAFDWITYQKGATVIAMFERFLGEAAFRRGVQRYLREHAHGNATATQFLAAISAEAGRDVAPAFASFLDQSGLPLVSFELDCKGAPTLRLSQKRYLPAGAPGTPASLWQIPLCVRWHGGKTCSLMKGAQAEIPLEGAKACPAWVEPNEGGIGYYVSQTSPAVASSLTKARGELSASERLAFLSDLGALARANAVSYANVLAMASSFANDPERRVVQSVASLVGHLREAELVSPAQGPAYARYLRELFGKRASSLGWQPRPADDEDARLLRADLVPLVADAGEDGTLRAEAKRMAQAWLDDHATVDPDLVDAVLAVAAAYGDRALYDRMLAAARTTTDRSERRRLLGALGAFRDPAIVKEALGLVLTNAFDVRESIAILWRAASEPRTVRLAWQWLQSSFDALVAKLPRDGGARLPWATTGLCDSAEEPKVKAFFAERAKRFEGGPRHLAQALEVLHDCASLKDAQAGNVAGFFGGKR